MLDNAPRWALGRLWDAAEEIEQGLRGDVDFDATQGEQFALFEEYLGYDLVQIDALRLHFDRAGFGQTYQIVEE